MEDLVASRSLRLKLHHMRNWKTWLGCLGVVGLHGGPTRVSWTRQFVWAGGRRGWLRALTQGHCEGTWGGGGGHLTPRPARLVPPPHTHASHYTRREEGGGCEVGEAFLAVVHSLHSLPRRALAALEEHIP